MKLGLLFSLLFSTFAHATPVIDGITLLRKIYQLSPQYDLAPVQNITVAILDSGYEGLFDRNDKGEISLKSGVLPPSTELVENYGSHCELNPNKRLGASAHGRVMAQTVWAMTANNPAGPRFVLLNSNGIPNFRCAVKYAMDVAKADIILFSQTFPYGGDFNGKGFINSYVNEAIARGIIWINAAGNYAGNVYTGAIKEVTTLRLKSHATDIPVEIVASWSGTPENQAEGTDKDLDIEVLDSKGNRLPVANAKQVARLSNQPVDPNDPREEDLHPFEKASLVLRDRNREKDAQDVYWIRILKRSGSFTENDKLRVTLMVADDRTAPVADETGKPVPTVEFLDATNDQEIMVVADNPNAITVGDTESLSSRGPTLDGRTKPEIIMPRSMVKLSSGEEQAGSSHAAAMLAGIVVQMKAMAPSLTREDIIKFVGPGSTPAGIARVPAPGTLPPGTTPVNLDTLKIEYVFGRELAETLEKAAPNIPMQPFKLPDGTFIMSMDRPPAMETGIFRGFAMERYKDKLQSLEYYVSMKASSKPDERPVAFWSIRDTTLSPTDSFPWERFPGYAKTDFLQLKYIPFVDMKVPGKSFPNMWRTPSVEKLLAATR